MKKPPLLQEQVAPELKCLKGNTARRMMFPAATLET
jgi:hypothetical protein